MRLPSLARLNTGFGPVPAEPDELEGIAYELEIPERWDVKPPPRITVTRGSYATSIPTLLGSDKRVVVLVRPLDALLPHEVDCPATKNTNDPNAPELWHRDCLKLSKAEYESEMAHVDAVVGALQGSSLLPTLYFNAILHGKTHNAPPGFLATLFGVQIWSEVDVVAVEYIRTRRISRQEFIQQLLPHIEQACSELLTLGKFHFDLHLGNVGFVLNHTGVERCVFLDPASIKDANNFSRCDRQSFVDEFDFVILDV